VKPYYQDDAVTIYHGDCRDILPALTADVLVTDPPYGINYRTPPGRARYPKGGWTLQGDTEPFDPSHLLGFKRAVIFGANHFADRLPASAGWIVWDKRDGMPSNHQSDCELAWTNVLGSVRLVAARWNGGGSLLAENGPARAIHPTQKPLRLMRGVLELVSQAGDVVMDPYCGTGTTLRAAKDRGRKAIGIEIDERFCEIAARRMGQEVLDFGGTASLDDAA
jgi:site-specific DNA-methyltransferase (adenine-specific)